MLASLATVLICMSFTPPPNFTPSSSRLIEKNKLQVHEKKVNSHTNREIQLNEFALKIALQIKKENLSLLVQKITSGLATNEEKDFFASKIGIANWKFFIKDIDAIKNEIKRSVTGKNMKLSSDPCSQEVLALLAGTCTTIWYLIISENPNMTPEDWAYQLLQYSLCLSTSAALASLYPPC